MGQAYELTNEATGKKLRNLVSNDRMKRYTVDRMKLNERLPKMDTVLNAERTTTAD